VSIVSGRDSASVQMELVSVAPDCSTAWGINVERARFVLVCFPARHGKRVVENRKAALVDARPRGEEATLETIDVACGTRRWTINEACDTTLWWETLRRAQDWARDRSRDANVAVVTQAIAQRRGAVWRA